MMRASRTFTKALFVTGLFCLSGPAFAQSNAELESRLNRLQNEVETLNRAVYRGQTPPPSAGGASSADHGLVADMQVRIQQLEAELQQMVGQIEEQTFQINQLQQNLERSLSDMELRLNEMSSGAPATSGLQVPPQNALNTPGQKLFVPQEQPAGQLGQLRLPPQTGQAAPPPVINNDTPEGQYESAFQALTAGDYDTAMAGFQSFVDQNPQHELAGNAVYWLGETHYVRGDYRQAAQVFARGYQNYPEGSKAPDNLLKLAMSLAAMDSNEDACVALNQLKTSFPEQSTPVARRAEQENERLRCGL